MYLQRFGLRREPFSIAPDPRTLFLSERHREALAHLRFGAQGGGGFVLLTGAIGAGKTTVCRAFLEQLPNNLRVAYVFNPQLNSLELLQTVCEEFGVAAGASPKACVDALNRFLLERHAAGEHCLLVIDEAQALETSVLEQLRLLTNLETSSHKLLQILLIGQPELRDMLARPELEQLAQRVIARYHLGALEPAETAAYVAHRLRGAGWQGELPFDAKALRLMHALSGGVPRRINLLADRALLALYATESSRASPRLLRQAARELAGEEAAPPPRPLWPLLLAGGVLIAGAVAGAHALRALPEPVDTTAPTPVRIAVKPPLVEPPQGFANSDEALRALAPRWGLSEPPAQPCAPPAGELRCWQAKLSLPALRALDRPGVLSLLDAEGQAQTLLLLELGPDTALLQGAQGEPVKLPLLTLANRWSGDYRTLWRAAPSLAAEDAWLDAQLDAAGLPAAKNRAARVAAFQRSEGLRADGRPGPLTLMRLAQRADANEPRLLPR